MVTGARPVLGSLHSRLQFHCPVLSGNAAGRCIQSTNGRFSDNVSSRCVLRMLNDSITATRDLDTQGQARPQVVSREEGTGCGARLRWSVLACIARDGGDNGAIAVQDAIAFTRRPRSGVNK